MSLNESLTQSISRVELKNFLKFILKFRSSFQQVELFQIVFS